MARNLSVAVGRVGMLESSAEAMAGSGLGKLVDEIHRKRPKPQCAF